MRRLGVTGCLAAVVLLLHLGGSASADGSFTAADGSYRAVEPPGWDRRSALPLVLFLHGYGQSSADMVGDSGVAAAATSLGALFVAPDGLHHAWAHVGAPTRDRDDIAFLGAVITDAERRWPIDAAKVYASGFSIGASMVWDLACHAAQGFAAFLPVSGDFWLPYPERCESGPVNLRHVHGLADTTVPMAGRTIRGRFTQGNVDKGWGILRATDGCAVAPDRTASEDVHAWEGKLACRIWSSCQSGRQLELCTHSDGHDMEPAFLHASLIWAMQLGR